MWHWERQGNGSPARSFIVLNDGRSCAEPGNRCLQEISGDDEMRGA
jgi:hypothetical protein